MSPAICTCSEAYVIPRSSFINNIATLVIKRGGGIKYHSVQSSCLVHDQPVQHRTHIGYANNICAVGRTHAVLDVPDEAFVKPLVIFHHGIRACRICDHDTCKVVILRICFGTGVYQTQRIRKVSNIDVIFDIGYVRIAAVRSQVIKHVQYSRAVG